MKKSSEKLSEMQDRMATRQEQIRTGQVRIVPPPKESPPPAQKQ